MLYHFSEDPSIMVFHPRPTPSMEGHPSVVWAIDEEHAPHYFFPRACPRVICWCEETTSDEDRIAMFSLMSVTKLAAVESRWLERIRRTQLYRYTMPQEAFDLQNSNAGYYVARETVEPVQVEPMGDLLDHLTASQLELRFTPSLFPLRDRIISSTLGFSVIRFANAIP
jgi:hypothetical protein